MAPLSKPFEQNPRACEVCGTEIMIDSLPDTLDAPCPHCGCLVWFSNLIQEQELDFFVDQGRCYRIKSPTKKGAMLEMVNYLTAVAEIHPREGKAIVDKILEREELGPTGVGKGLAIPHAAHASLEKMIGLAAYHQDGLDYQSLDRQPVHQLFMILTPPTESEKKLKALSAIVKAWKDEMTE